MDHHRYPFVDCVLFMYVVLLSGCVSSFETPAVELVEPAAAVESPSERPTPVKAASESAGLWLSPRCAYPGHGVEKPAIHPSTHTEVDAPTYLGEVNARLLRSAMLNNLSLLQRNHGHIAKLPRFELRVAVDGQVDRVVTTECSGAPNLDAAVAALLIQQQLPEPPTAAPIYLDLRVLAFDRVGLHAYVRYPADTAS